MGAKENSYVSEIKAQLKRIVSTPAFKSSRILSGFLEFVIEKTLAGKEDEIKEYSIGISVLSRNIDFNPQLDAIVRIHAGRLRRALKEYYYDAGKNDPIVIEIPKGSYIPVFQPKNKIQNNHSNGVEKTKPTRFKPVVAVFPFRNISQDSSRDFFADGLGEQLSTELTLFHDLAVISYNSSRHVASKTNDVKEAAMLLGAKYVLTGSIQHDNKHLRIWVQLIFCNNGEQLWAKSFQRNNTASGIFEVQNEIVKSILTAIGGYYGAITRDMMKLPDSNHTNGIDSLDAVSLYYHYQKVWTSEALQKAINALEASVKADPDYALAWAMLGELYLDDKVLAFKKIKNPLEEGLKCALRAVNIDPKCQHAYQALAWIYLFYHKREECLKSVDQCIAINPNAADVWGAMGFVLICAGEFDRGFILLQDAIQYNPYGPWWFNAGFVFHSLYKKDYQSANHWIEKIDMPQLLWDPMLKASVQGHLNRLEEAGKNLKLLNQLLPDPANQVKIIIESFLLSNDLNKEILAGLKKAGLNSASQKKISTLKGSSLN
jgi:TolB-like protein